MTASTIRRDLALLNGQCDNLSVTTPCTNTMQELADSEGIEVDCLGGRLRSLSQSFVGAWTRRRWSG